jgi:hypothetical protein
MATGALNPDNVQVGTNNGPGLYVAPVGSVAPSDAATAWGTGWQVLGYISNAGPEVASAITSTSLVPWQSVIPLRTIITERTITMHFILWELNPVTLGMYFDADPPTADAQGNLAFDVASQAPGHQYALGIDAMDNEAVFRVVFPRATLSAAGNMTIARGAIVPLEVTLTALDDAGVMAHVIRGVVAAPSIGQVSAEKAAQAVAAGRSR